MRQTQKFKEHSYWKLIALAMIENCRKNQVLGPVYNVVQRKHQGNGIKQDIVGTLVPNFEYEGNKLFYETQP